MDSSVCIFHDLFHSSLILSLIAVTSKEAMELRIIMFVIEFCRYQHQMQHSYFEIILLYFEFELFIDLPRTFVSLNDILIPDFFGSPNVFLLY